VLASLLAAVNDGMNVNGGATLAFLGDIDEEGSQLCDQLKEAVFIGW
jgi:hypothetical protein